MTPVFSWLESTAFSMWMRESPSVFAFPAVLCMHAIGMAVVVGVQTFISLRILGVAPEIPLGELRRFVPLMWAGFYLNAASGIALLIAYPTKAFTLLRVATMRGGWRVRRSPAGPARSSPAGSSPTPTAGCSRTGKTTRSMP